MTTALLPTCWAQAFRPKLIDAMLQTAAFLGLALETPAHACCGLPAWQAGDAAGAREAARRTVAAFEGYDAVVAASPACLRMVSRHIPTLLADADVAAAAHSLAGKACTWCDFIVQSGRLDRLRLRFEGRILYFRPCTVEDDRGAAVILERIHGAHRLPDIEEICCGFGGNLAWRHPDLSRAIAASTARILHNRHADLVLTDDVGCTLRLSRALKQDDGPPILHLAEFMALFLP